MPREKQYLKYKTEGGEEVVFEVEAPAIGFKDELERVANTSAIPIAEETLEAAIGKIKPAAQLVLDSFRSLNQPSAIELEFGVKVAARAGVLIASADSEATFKVTLKWQNAD